MRGKEEEEDVVLFSVDWTIFLLSFFPSPRWEVRNAGNRCVENLRTLRGEIFRLTTFVQKPPPTREFPDDVGIQLFSSFGRETHPLCAESNSLFISSGFFILLPISEEDDRSRSL